MREMQENFEKLKNNILRQARGYAYYFNEEGIYCKIPISEVVESAFLNVHMFPEEEGDFWFEKFNFTKLICENANLALKIICRLKEGDTLEQLRYYIKNTKLRPEEKREDLERFITKIEKPRFLRTPENLNETTFDFIYMDVNIVTEWKEDRKQYLASNMDKILKKVVKKLTNDSTFRKYEVPINFLKVSRMTLKNDSVLQFVLELKIR